MAVWKWVEEVGNDSHHTKHIQWPASGLLEALLAFKQPRSLTLWAKANGVDLDAVKRARILRFVIVYPHNESAGDPQHDPILLAESGSVLSDLLEFIETVDSQHYNAMVTLSANSIAVTADE